MRYRSFSSSVCVVLAGCGGAEPAEQEPGSEATEATAAPPSARADSPAALQLALAGESSLLNGGARLEVQEESPIANLVITAVYEPNHDHLVQLQLVLVGVENAMGFHRTQIGPPGTSAACAAAYLDKQSYSSRGGTLEVTLTADGSITGLLEAELFKDSSPGGLDELGEALHLSGTFEGSWSLLCRSRVVGLPGEHLIADSPYCNSLQF
jgi:hypothetical protein